MADLFKECMYCSTSTEPSIEASGMVGISVRSHHGISKNYQGNSTHGFCDAHKEMHFTELRKGELK